MTHAELEALARERAAETIAAHQRFLAGDGAALVATVAERIVGSLRGGGKLLVFGNGGSAAQAEHMAAELIGRYIHDRDALPAIALADNAATVTAIANDYDFADVFARQVRAFARPEDVLLAMSTSGGSSNAVAGLEAGRTIGATTIGLTGAEGGDLARVAELSVAYPSRSTPRIQEGHELIIHTICEIVERGLMGGAD